MQVICKVTRCWQQYVKSYSSSNKENSLKILSNVSTAKRLKQRKLYHVCCLKSEDIPFSLILEGPRTYLVHVFFQSHHPLLDWSTSSMSALCTHHKGPCIKISIIRCLSIFQTNHSIHAFSKPYMEYWSASTAVPDGRNSLTATSLFSFFLSKWFVKKNVSFASTSFQTQEYIKCSKKHTLKNSFKKRF